MCIKDILQNNFNVQAKNEIWDFDLTVEGFYLNREREMFSTRDLHLHKLSVLCCFIIKSSL